MRPQPRKSLNLFLPLLTAIFLFAVTASVNSQSLSSTSSSNSKSGSSYERHWVDLGIGLGLDYGGLLGAKIAFLPIPNVDAFVGVGYYLFSMGWNVGATWHILPSTQRYTLRPNIKIMYGTNGGTTVSGNSDYNKNFYGFTPGVGLEIMFGHGKRNGFDLDVNFPIHGQDFWDQIDMMKNDPQLDNVKTPWPVAFAFGYHHEF